VIRTLGGCGGTLVARLFGALPRSVVLSETNPRSANLFGGHLNPLRQLRRWRPELLEHVADFDEAEIGYPPRFGDMLAGIARAAQQYEFRLILRDFNYADFVGIPFLWPPQAELSLDLACAGRFLPRSLLLVRHPADQLASLRTHSALRNVLSAERYVAGAHAFLDALGTAPLFRYEALTRSPAPVFEAMCAAIGVAFSPDALTAFADVSTVTGSLARAGETRIMEPPPSPAAAAARAELAQAPGYARLLERLRYAA
jgi:hypothetical protein